MKGSSYSPSDHCQGKSGIESKKQQLTRSEAHRLRQKSANCEKKVIEAAELSNRYCRGLTVRGFGIRDARA